VDNDCDGVIDEGFDADADGWTTCEGDCDNADATVFPGASELAPGIDDEDNDCDGSVDEVFEAFVGVVYPTSSAYVLNVQFYWHEDELGDWWDATASVPAATQVSYTFLPSSWDVEGQCGLRFNVTEGNPASGWFCQDGALDATVMVNIWWLGEWYDRFDLVVWNTPSPSDGGACSALLIVDYLDPACVP